MINLHNGDCLEIMKQIPDGSIDAIITDPPYWTTACKWDSVIPFEPMWKELKRIIKPNGAIVLFWSEPFSSALRMSNIKQYKYDWKWDKVRWSNFVTVKIRPFNSFEDILIFYKNQPTYNPQMIKWKPYTHTGNGRIWESKLTSKNLKSGIKTISNWDRYPISIITFSKENWLHPTQKPVALIEYLIKTYTNEWETVLDFTAGSFTTAVACENTNRKWICIEQDLWYCKIWANRINENRIKLWLDILDFSQDLEK